MAKARELLPCPFCGGEAEVRRLDLDAIEEGLQVYGVWCVDDLHAVEHGGFQHGHYIDNYATRAEAVAAWNTRAKRTCSGHLERIITLENLCRDLWDDTVQIHELEGWSTSEELEQRMESLGLLGVEHD